MKNIHLTQVESWKYKLRSPLDRHAHLSHEHIEVFYRSFLERLRSDIVEPAHLTEPAHLHLNSSESEMEENEKRCMCLYSPSSNRMVCCNVRDILYHTAYKELDHTFAHNTNVYVCHLCIKNTFTDIFQYLCYSIKCFLNNNSDNPIVAFLNNLALLSKDEIMSFTLLTLQPKKIEKINF